MIGKIVDLITYHFKVMLIKLDFSRSRLQKNIELSVLDIQYNHCYELVKKGKNYEFVKSPFWGRKIERR